MSGSKDFEKIGEDVLAELGRRLETKAGRETLPGTLLMKLAENYLKYLEKKQAQEGDRHEEVLTALEIIDQPGLSIDKKYEILEAYIDELQDELRTVSVRMEEIHNEWVALYGERPPREDDPETVSELS